MRRLNRKESEEQLEILKKDMKQGFMYPRDWEDIIVNFEEWGFDDLANTAKIIYEGWKMRNAKTNDK